MGIQTFRRKLLFHDIIKFVRVHKRFLSCITIEWWNKKIAFCSPRTISVDHWQILERCIFSQRLVLISKLNWELQTVISTMPLLVWLLPTRFLAITDVTKTNLFAEVFQNFLSQAQFRRRASAVPN